MNRHLPCVCVHRRHILVDFNDSAYAFVLVEKPLVVQRIGFVSRHQLNRLSDKPFERRRLSIKKYRQQSQGIDRCRRNHA